MESSLEIQEKIKNGSLQKMPSLGKNNFIIKRSPAFLNTQY
jgi:hypothetical protein